MTVRYHTTMLCGGQSMMLTPSVRPSFDMKTASAVLGDSVIRSSDDLVEFTYCDLKLTLYQNGSIMFYHFTDLDAACRYAEEVTRKITE